MSIVCNGKCEPRLAISTVRVWTYSILSAEVEPYLPTIPDQSTSILSIASPYTEDDLVTLTGPSSFWTASGGVALTVQDTADQTYFTSIAVKLPKPSLV